MVLAVAFGVGMILLLPKYARFIHDTMQLRIDVLGEEAAKEKSGGE